MRIVIDLQGAQTESRFRGIGRYSIALAKAIARNRGEHDVIIVLNGMLSDSIEAIRAEFYNILPQDNIRVWYTPTIAQTQPSETWQLQTAEVIREAFIASLQPDIVHITSLFEGFLDNAVSSIGTFDTITPISVSLYDLIPLLNSNYYLKPNPAYQHYYLEKIDHLKRASLLLAISEHSKQEGIDHIGHNGTPVINISTAADSCFTPLKLNKSQSQYVLETFGINKPFLLYTGGADERKNLPRLLRAYARLPINIRTSHQLVLAGKIPDGNLISLLNEANSLGLQQQELVLTGYVSEDNLIKLYNLCKLFIFPSWHEGFGLPALEAMSCGAPVIGSNTSSLPEVIGNADALFDPFSEKSITDKIQQALTNDTFRQSLTKRALKQASRYSWDKTAKTAISSFADLLAHSKKSKTRRTILPPAALIDRLASIIPPDTPDQDIADTANKMALNQTKTGLKQLFIDVSELSQRDAATGVQRVTRNIITELLNHPPFGYQVELVYATVQSEGYSYARQYTANILKQHEVLAKDTPINPRSGDIFLGLDLQHHVVIEQSDYLLQLKKQNVKVYFVVYDLLPITYPNYFAKGISKLHSRWLRVISQFTGLICISKTVSIEVENWIGKHLPQRRNELKISFFNMGADIEGSFFPDTSNANNTDSISSFNGTNSFLVVGTLEPRKGQYQVLSAFENLWSKNISVNLILVGKQGWMVEDLVERIKNHSQLNNQLFWFDNVSDEDLENLYSTSACLIAASKGEGFGLPIIEAARHNLPIIARDIPIFREVAGDHAFYFSSDTAESLCQSITHWLELYSQRKHPNPKLLSWVTWQKSADELMTAIIGEGNTAPRPTKQLLLDISELAQRDAKTGIQRVVKNLLVELISFQINDLIVEPVYATLTHGYRYARKFMAEFAGIDSEYLNDESIEYRAGDIFLGLDLQPQIVPAQRYFYQHLRQYGVTVKFVVYDLLCALMPQHFVEGADKGYQQWLQAVSENNGVICISQAVAEEYRQWDKENAKERVLPFNIDWFHLGADLSNSAPTFGLPSFADKTLNSIKQCPSFLMVGTIEPRKGVSQVLAAFELLWNNGVNANLIIAGKRGWMVDTLIEKIVSHPKYNKRLFWLDGISDEFLEKVYHASNCLIAASMGEGFGLPLIEAAQYKLPIIARDIPVFREVAGDHAFYFSGEAPADLCTAIQTWLQLQQANQHPKSDFMPWLTWCESAYQLLEALDITIPETSKTKEVVN